jgi:uncharacterized protein
MIAASVGSAGVFLLIATVWAARLGASAVAGIFGTFSAFWLSLGLMLMGLNNGWFGLTDAAQVGSVLTPYVLSWLIVFVALTLATLRLPLAFTVGFVLVSATFALLLANLLTGQAIFSTLAGLTTFGFCAVYAYIFFDAMGQELGGRAMPMGNALVK